MKYRLTDETKRVGCKTLHRIECVKAFSNVKVGEKGGWIENEYNLSQNGNAWVYGEAQVYGYAQVWENVEVCDNTHVRGDAKVSGNAKVHGYVIVEGIAEVKGDAEISKISDYIVFKNSFSSGRHFTWTRSNNMWTVGCFHGTGEQLIEKARQDNEDKAKCYALYVKLVEDLQQANDANPSI